jgi:addiction module HigA family antidote
MARLPKDRPPSHPGAILREDFLIPLGMTQVDLADKIRVSYPRVNEIVNAKRGITPDSALRLSKLFGTTPEFWLNGQRNWDLWHAMRAPEAKF